MFKITSLLLILITSATFAYADPFDTDIEKKKEMNFSETTIKLKFEYPTEMVFGFVTSCTNNIAPRMGLYPQQAFPIALKMCSCIMDQFRGDFTRDAFVKGGKKLAISMAPQYSEVCKQLVGAKGM